MITIRMAIQYLFISACGLAVLCVAAIGVWIWWAIFEWLIGGMV